MRWTQGCSQQPNLSAAPQRNGEPHRSATGVSHRGVLAKETAPRLEGGADGDAPRHHRLALRLKEVPGPAPSMSSARGVKETGSSAIPLSGLGRKNDLHRSANERRPAESPCPLPASSQSWRGVEVWVVDCTSVMWNVMLVRIFLPALQVASATLNFFARSDMGLASGFSRIPMLWVKPRLPLNSPQTVPSSVVLGLRVQMLRFHWQCN